MDIKSIVKSFLTYVFNPISMLRIGKVGSGVCVKSGLMVQNPSGIMLKKDVQIGRMARLSCYGEGKIVIEEGVYICHFFSAMTADILTIKKNTLIASYVAVIGENHGMNPESGQLYADQPLIGKPVTIGECCWIGEKVMILPGVTIGDWCIIGAGAVVNVDIPSYTIAVGNPVKVVKRWDFKTHQWVKC